jgi:hypothetical protein
MAAAVLGTIQKPVLSTQLPTRRHTTAYAPMSTDYLKESLLRDWHMLIWPRNYLQNVKMYYDVYRRVPVNTILSQLNLIYSLSPCFLNIYFIIVLPSTSRCPMSSFLSDFSYAFIPSSCLQARTHTRAHAHTHMRARTHFARLMYKIAGFCEL